MTYEEKKTELLKKKANLLRKYNKLFIEAMDLAKESNDLINSNYSKIEINDWKFLLANDEELRKIVRLIVVLGYVEFPNDQNVLETLDINIEDNLNHNNEYLKKIQ